MYTYYVFFILVAQTHQSYDSLVSTFSEKLRMDRAMQQLIDLEKKAAQLQDGATPDADTPLTPTAGVLRLQNAAVGYENHPPILVDVSLEVAPGQVLNKKARMQGRKEGKKEKEENNDDDNDDDDDDDNDDEDGDDMSWQRVDGHIQEKEAWREKEQVYDDVLKPATLRAEISQHYLFI